MFASDASYCSENCQNILTGSQIPPLCHCKIFLCDNLGSNISRIDIPSEAVPTEACSHVRCLSICTEHLSVRLPEDGSLPLCSLCIDEILLFASMLLSEMNNDVDGTFHFCIGCLRKPSLRSYGFVLRFSIGLIGQFDTARRCAVFRSTCYASIEVRLLSDDCGQSKWQSRWNLMFQCVDVVRPRLWFVAQARLITYCSVDYLILQDHCQPGQGSIDPNMTSVRAGRISESTTLCVSRNILEGDLCLILLT